ILVVPLRHRQQRCLAVPEYTVDRRTKRKALPLLQRSIDVPECVVGSLAFQSKRNDLGKIELEPEARRITEAWAFLVAEHGCAEPAMLSNVRNDFLVMFVELEGIDAQSCKHRRFHPRFDATDLPPVTAPPHSPACRAGWQPRGGGGRRAPRW